tara:strand:+ start:101 stop:691 length:591 start_codon:yes stop_codon:yes gene_type:complete
MFILIFAPLICFSQQITVIDAKGYHYNDILKQMIECDLSVRYDEQTRKTYLYIGEAITTTAYTLEESDVDSLNIIFDKYFKWEKQANEMKVKIEKNIKDISLEGWFKYGNGEWSNSKIKNCIFRSLFFSQSESNHQLVFQFGKITDYNNEYSDHTPENVYLSKSQVLSLRKGFSKEYLDSILKKQKEKDKVEDLFK